MRVTNRPGRSPPVSWGFLLVLIMPVYDIGHNSGVDILRPAMPCTCAPPQVTEVCRGCRFNAFYARTPEPYPGSCCRVWDALGNWIPYTCRVDTETGETVRMERTDGRFVLEAANNLPKLIYEAFAAPLVVEVVVDGAPYVPDDPAGGPPARPFVRIGDSARDSMREEKT